MKCPKCHKENIGKIVAKYKKAYWEKQRICLDCFHHDSEVCFRYACIICEDGKVDLPADEPCPVCHRG